jgi:hypothetical protein
MNSRYKINKFECIQKHISDPYLNLQNFILYKSKTYFFLNTTLPKEHNHIYFTILGATKLKIQNSQNKSKTGIKWVSLQYCCRWPVGPAGQGTPRVSDTEQSSGATGHCAAAARRQRASPAVTSSLHDLCDLAKRLSHLAGPIADPRADGGDHGRTAGLDHGGTSEEATVVQINAWTSISGCWGT